ncbi:hypothetical protein [Natrononativus amylolyticus]|uniref:hypothetical protein n=1 Tax=Natrononativus amylolyticus TaxID=2963434 RepID=UPI0020CE5F93|nr:hypothetical protein [Natrononativus amylolyticus]
MVDEDYELEEDIGEATIVYETPDGETAEKTVPNEHVAYFQDHWIVKTGTDEQGRDIVRRIPAQRVYHVERTVDEFAEEVKTLLDRVESVASSIQTKIPLGGGGRTPDREEPHHIDISTGESADRDAGSE